jgi:hypothetical protein
MKLDRKSGARPRFTEEVSGHFLDIGNIDIFESIGGALVVVATYIQRQKPGFAAGVDPLLRHIEVAFEHAAFFFEYVTPTARRDAKIECYFQDAGAPGGEIEVEAGILRRP